MLALCAFTHIRTQSFFILADVLKSNGKIGRKPTRLKAADCPHSSKDKQKVGKPRIWNSDKIYV